MCVLKPPQPAASQLFWPSCQTIAVLLSSLQGPVGSPATYNVVYLPHTCSLCRSERKRRPLLCIQECARSGTNYRGVGGAINVAEHGEFPVPSLPLRSKTDAVPERTKARVPTPRRCHELQAARLGFSLCLSFFLVATLVSDLI